jgi:hypothetical protein
VHAPATVDTALRLADAGASATEIAARLTVPRSTVRDWLAGAVPHVPGPDEAGQCAADHQLEQLPQDYVYLLGLYLGDGCVSRSARGVPKLRLSLDRAYPGILGNAVTAIHSVRGGVVGSQLRPRNCVEVYSYWQHWPCLFPQHGPGKKHHRPIVLTEWQERLTDRWPAQLVAGLIHSDGCRFESTGRNWSSPRYVFKQLSGDIRNIFCGACDRLALHWTHAGDAIYVSRKSDVAVLDSFIGPKR